MNQTKPAISAPIAGMRQNSQIDFFNVFIGGQNWREIYIASLDQGVIGV
jgi:hypothetical protein